MKYKCIVFDCDGVLVDTEEISISTLVEMGNVLGANIDFEFAIVNFLGKSLEYCFDCISEKSGKALPESFEAEYRATTFKRFREELKPIEGIHSLLDKLDVPFCVASNGPLDKMKLNLETTNLKDKFEGKMFSAYQINKFKPDPALFIHAAATLGFKPEECAVVEDSDVGVKAGVKGGFDVFGFANDRSEALLKKEGAKLFYHMDDLYSLLKGE